MKLKRVLYFLLPLIFLVACNTNDYSTEYQKERLYDGYPIAMDTLKIVTYKVLSIDGADTITSLHSEVTKWYDMNGYHSMSESILYIGDGGVRKTVEKITRDKHSLSIARDIVIETTNTETAVTLSRLKSRRGGQEDWLLRHYLDPQKYIEDASVVIYGENSKVSKKKFSGSDSLTIIETEIYDENGRISIKKPWAGVGEHAEVETYYNSANGLIDSLVAKVYKNSDPNLELLNKYTESYYYQLDELGMARKNITLKNDSLVFISEYKYHQR